MERVKVLLIEDDDDLRETTCELLECEGFEAVPAHNGSSGVQKAIQTPPDVIVCDINLPDISGYEIFSTLNQIPSTTFIPFIFLSAKSTRDDILLGLHLGVDDYITKPFEMSELVGVIKRRVECRRKLLAQSDEKFNTLLESSPSGACILSSEKIEYANGALCALLGYSDGEMAGMPVHKLIHNEQNDSFCSMVGQCILGVKQSFSLSTLLYTKGQQSIEVRAYGNVVCIRGERRVICTMIPTPKQTSKGAADRATAVKLTEREVEVLRLACKGLSNHEIGNALFVSERTVEGHKARIFTKTNTKNTVSLALWAVRNGYVEL